ncbi:PREDICTED: ribonuclease P protein subunit p38-like [Amphimedon queenslandica]|uniref:Ribosomal protein L7Ae/L30e/S12e/Gadd45 domain-containing protein n=1 Tax=Amphimedon queenslandica TaxID=400682 RepID=A0AAN0JGC3_AMPQE|nr:PREDICTED: ribonuclease P protein subunit p38-like [Amphimedon queenslandica]|eukprot:XP_019855851.1 PREDICTED: ribonuclease P protein subunit p38-like [Amphimedon queenslandica]
MSKIKRPKVKHSLDSPYKLQWPSVGEKCAQKTIQLLMDVASNKKKFHKASIDAVPLTDNPCLKKQLIIGVNAFTRCLERGHMRCGVVCLSAKPALLTGHILMLAATRNCPLMGLYDLSSKLAPTLGIKSVLALGFKKLEKDEEDPFYDIVSHLTINCAPLIDVPWLLKPKEVVSGNDGITSLSKEPAQKKMKFDEKEEIEDQDGEETKQDEDKSNKKLTDNLYTPLMDNAKC